MHSWANLQFSRSTWPGRLRRAGRIRVCGFGVELDGDLAESHESPHMHRVPLSWTPAWWADARGSWRNGESSVVTVHGSEWHQNGTNPGVGDLRRCMTDRACCGKMLQMAERGGFEPPNREDPVNGFRDRRIQPLCHLSARRSQGRRAGVPAAPRVSRRTPGRVMAEREGFEPSRQVTPPTRFPVALLKPTRTPLRGASRRAP